MVNQLRLGVNIDHVATIRNARDGVEPDPIRAAILAANSGADVITVHLREDRRHISDSDVARLIKELKIPLNLEMAATQEMLNIAIKYKPLAVCLVPEKREEKTTEGGLNLTEQKNTLKPIIDRLLSEDIKVSLFIDPYKVQILEALKLNVPVIEFHVGHICETEYPSDTTADYAKLVEAVKFATENGLEVHAGHGINYKSVAMIARIKDIRELNPKILLKLNN